MIVVSEAFARRVWPGEDPLGERLVIVPPLPSDQPWRRTAVVVGVARDVRPDPFVSTPLPIVYLPLYWNPYKRPIVHLRAAAAPLSLFTLLRSETAAIDPEVAVLNPRTVETSIEQDLLFSQQFSLAVATIFGLVAVFLAAIGIFAAVAHRVTQRVPEIGIRMTLGARGSDVLRMMLRQGMAPVMIGITIGVAAALGLTRLIASMISGVTTTDPLSFAAVALGLTAFALLGCWLPARRATKVDPIAALRAE